MVTSKDVTYKLLPEWKITQKGKSLIISGGADARYEIELETSESSFFSELRSNTSFTRSALKLRDIPVLEELVTAEVVAPVLQKNKSLKVALLGDEHKLTISHEKNAQTADLLLIVRANSTYADLLEKVSYQDISKPHLFVDIAFHHTLSLGPLVFPGETACIACLQGRVSTRWGDDVPPSSPRTANTYQAVVSELIKTDLDRIAHGDTSLTNKTVSWNFQERAVKEDQLLKVPLCPVCTQNRIDPSGAIALPWTADESATNTIR